MEGSSRATQTHLSGGKEEDIDGVLVTFNADKLAGSFDSAGFTVDVVKNPKIPDRDLFIFDTETDELQPVDGICAARSICERMIAVE